MHPTSTPRLQPLAWLLGLLFCLAGWPGWVAARLLQAGACRAGTLSADDRAAQWHGDREVVGQVLRKLWHDQQMARHRLHHPNADLFGFAMAMDPVTAPGLTTQEHPDERIEHLLGRRMPPMPSSVLPGDSVDSRMQPAEHARPAAPITPEHQRQQLIAADREARARMALRHGPTELRLTILALMMQIGNARELKLWRRMAEDLHGAEAILLDVGQLLPGSRLPAFERLVDEVARQPLMHKRQLVEAARDLMRADGRVSPRERLWWLALRHRLQDRDTPVAGMRPVTGQGQSLTDLNLLERAYVATLTGYVARFVPMVGDDGQFSPASVAWWRGVMRRCGEDRPDMDRTPDADALVHALSGVQELSWMLRPMLMRAWTEEALNHSPQGLMSDDTADALRLLACLIDTPAPPMLLAHYPKEA